MLPRKLSFPQLPPAPPPYLDKRSYHPTAEDLHAFRVQLLQPLPKVSPPSNRPARRATHHSDIPPPPSRTPSPPQVVVSEDTSERLERQSRPRSSSRIQIPVPESQGHLSSASSTGSASPSTSSPVSPSAHPPTQRSPRGVRTVPLPPPPHPPPSHPLPRPPSPPPPPRPADFDILPSEPFKFSPPTPQHRSRFRSLAALRLTKATRQATAQITETMARQAAEETRRQTAEEKVRRVARERELEEMARRASAQETAKEYVQTVMESLLQGKLPPDDERTSILSACTQTCDKEDLDLSTVLQEMSIEGFPPIYWAIVNRSVASESGGVAPDSLVLALLNACRPLSPATLAAIRVACMVSSDNDLLQGLFRSIPSLSHISTRDALLLGPANEEDRVVVEEKRNGTGSWVALIKIPRFRLRMRVCQSVSVEFIASGRIWILAFSAVVETSSDGRSESKWYLSLELGDHSPPTPVNASLVILGSSDAAEDDSDDSRTIYFGPPMPALCPGRDKAIKIRLDDGPIGPHLLNESSILVDSNKTLHARLTHSTVTGSGADETASTRERELVTPTSEISYIPVSHRSPRSSNPHPSWNPPPTAAPRPPAGSPSSARKKKKRHANEVHVTLRRGGR